jgi:hypothetical protein
MGSKAKYLLLAAAVALMGQGCEGIFNAQVDSSAETGASSEVDATIDAELDAAVDIEAEERAGDEEADVVENDKAELNSYNEVQYDLP